VKEKEKEKEEAEISYGASSGFSSSCSSAGGSVTSSVTGSSTSYPGPLASAVSMRSVTSSKDIWGSATSVGVASGTEGWSADEREKFVWLRSPEKKAI